MDLDKAPCFYVIAQMETVLILDVALCLYIITHTGPYYTEICLPPFTLTSSTKMS